MPDMLSVIKTRRSVRKFSDKPVTSQAIKKILEAGRWAPSGLNNQPWRFLVIKNRAVAGILACFTRYGSVIRKASVVIVVCMDVADSYNREKDLMAMGACIENMLLEAHSLNVGACWLGEILNRKDDVAKFLDLPEDYEFLAVVSLGTPLKNKSKSSRKKLKALMIKT